MILTAILLGAAAIVGVGLVAAFWNDIIDWLKSAIEKVKEMINRIVYGTKVFLQKYADAIKEISKHYSQDELKKWHETIVTREVSEEEVPAEFRARAAYGMETDITDELQLALA